MERKIKKSFEEWCVGNNRRDLLDRWDYELNNCKPSYVASRSHKKYYFKCPVNLHESGQFKLDDVEKYFKCTVCNSFEQWCINNNRKDLLDRWDYNLNKIQPNKVMYGTTKKYYFKCPQNLHESELFNISKITSFDNIFVKCVKCGSFAFYLINKYGKDALKEYWDYNKNVVDPWTVQSQANCKVWIKCTNTDYHDAYQITPNSFVNTKHSCHYCTGQKTHPMDSFAQYHIDNTHNDFLKKYWSDKNTSNPFEARPYSNKKAWIKCQEKSYHDDYLTTYANFTNGMRCPYCSRQKVNYYDSLGYLYPNVLGIWSDKNSKSPYEYLPHSDTVVWWMCENDLHSDYKRKIDSELRCEFRCAECVRERTESFLQEKVRKYITDNYNLKILHEHNCTLISKNPKTGHTLPFDNDVLIKNSHLIIEVHGKAHYEVDALTNRIAKRNNTTPEGELHKRRLYDRYKRLVAHINKYYYLEIPYWTEQDESYKNLIDNKIAEILAMQESEVA